MCSVMSDYFVTTWTVARRFPCPWDFPVKNTEWVAITFSRGSSWPRDQLASLMSPALQVDALSLSHQGNPWKSNESILKEINSEYSLEELMLKLQYFGHLRQRAGSLKKTLMLAKGEWGIRWWDGSIAPPNQWTWIWASSRRYWRTGEPGVL